MGISCVMSINYVEVNIIFNSLVTGIITTFDNTKVNKYRRKKGYNIVLYSAFIGCYNSMKSVQACQ